MNKFDQDQKINEQYFQTLNDSGWHGETGLWTHSQMYSSLHQYPITQVYDLLAQQELELQLKLHNYEGKSSSTTHEKAKHRRGGKKNKN